MIEYYRVLSGAVRGREHDDQVTVFDSVGFALEDYSALRYLHDVTLARDIGTTIDLIPKPANPKDLYQLIAARPAGSNVSMRRFQTSAAAGALQASA